MASRQRSPFIFRSEYVLAVTLLFFLVIFQLYFFNSVSNLLVYISVYLFLGYSFLGFIVLRIAVNIVSKAPGIKIFSNSRNLNKLLNFDLMSVCFRSPALLCIKIWQTITALHFYRIVQMSGSMVQKYTCNRRLPIDCSSAWFSVTWWTIFVLFFSTFFPRYGNSKYGFITFARIASYQPHQN